jgi:micrococcal nuclease
MRGMPRVAVLALLLLTLPAPPEVALAGSQAAQATPARERAVPKRQPRAHGRRIEVDRRLVHINDGDTLSIRWKAGDVEVIRILGIDAPETGAPEHDIPHAQEFGAEARAFAQGAFAVTERVELLRAATLDPYGRTLGYVFLDGQNYSVAIVHARLAEESVSRFGDNGLPGEAAAVAAAAKEAGPLPFESPVFFRARMRRLAEWMKTTEVPQR